MKTTISRTACSVALATLLAAPLAAQAGVIVSADEVTASTSFPDSTFGNPLNLINQGGLATTYLSGVTDFATYIAGNPRHTTASAGAEWFTPFGATGATLTFDLGSVLTIESVAAWVDEFWGAGKIDVAVSLDGSTFASVGGFTPTDWATNVANYGADVFTFSATSARFVQLTLSGCPQPLSSAGGGCGMGEVAFGTGQATVPEPTSIALGGMALLGLAAARRRRR